MQINPFDAIVHFPHTSERGHYTGGRVLCNCNAYCRLDCPEKSHHRANELGAETT